MSNFLLAILAVVVVSAISLIGVVSIFLKQEKLEKLLLLLVIFSAGALLGDAFIHLIPESFEMLNAETASYTILIGIIVFFFLERVIHWHHCHDVECEKRTSKAFLPHIILVGDAFHNLIDGLIIGASFLVSIPLGIATTTAVIFHEIPQEIGDFGMLLYGGFTKVKALIFNFLSGLIAVFGVVIAFVIDAQFANTFSALLLPFAAGGFIYISTADLIPEIHKHNAHSIKDNLFHIGVFLLGIGMMAILLFLE